MNKSTSPFKKIIILVILLAVPGLLYYLLQEKGKNRYHPLSVFGPKQVASTFHTKRGKQIPDTIYHTIRNFQLTDQEGQSYSLKSDSSSITVVNFFFSRCPSFCKDMNKEMARVAGQFAGNSLVRFMSITVDPEFDTPEVLKKYSSGYNLPGEKWKFLTGNQDTIFQIARKDFLVDALKDTSSVNNFIHSPMLILLDPSKRIRGYYDSTNKAQVDLLSDEIKVLITEELRKVKYP
ncbi:SCO family protein [Daejeonella oryzae]|uniref:SCO family protein n=1 Tax=Daejeonella oryzae TaxID=1122943 RepID=UPI000415B637|nr:SCO family protein [Daejeonella oryzae]